VFYMRSHKSVGTPKDFTRKLKTILDKIIFIFKLRCFTKDLISSLTTNPNYFSGLAIIVSSKEIFLLRRFSFCSVHQSLRFTPILFEGQFFQRFLLHFSIMNSIELLSFIHRVFGMFIHLKPKIQNAINSANQSV
jgi:hypothetical protein